MSDSPIWEKGASPREGGYGGRRRGAVNTVDIMDDLHRMGERRGTRKTSSDMSASDSETESSADKRRRRRRKKESSDRSGRRMSAPVPSRTPQRSRSHQGADESGRRRSSGRRANNERSRSTASMDSDEDEYEDRTERAGQQAGLWNSLVSDLPCLRCRIISQRLFGLGGTLFPVQHRPPGLPLRYRFLFGQLVRRFFRGHVS
jgi:hypothetical protein